MSSVQLPPKSSRLRRWRRPLLAAALVLTAAGAFVGWRLNRVFAHRQQLRATIAALDAADPGWRLEDLEARRPAVPDDENSGELIRAARAQVSGPVSFPVFSLYEELERLPSDVA